MPVVVISEGPTDVGDFDSGGREGCVRVLTRRILEERHSAPLASERFIRGRWARVQKQGMKSTDGFRVKVAATVAAYQARMPDCEGLVAVVDRDKPHHAGRLAELHAGREEARKQGVALADRTAVGMAVEEVEAWLLADHDFMTSGLGRDKGVPRPEELRRPKEEYRRILQELGHDPGECYDRIANEASLKILRDKCPSFAAFAEDVAKRVAIKPE
jgi:hypothetical protein